MVNRPINASAYSIGVSKWIDPLYMVAVQLKTLIAEGTAMMKLKSENTSAEYVEIPAANMWCAQTRNPKTPMATLENAIALYPKMRLREKHGMTSLITPKPGK